MCAVIPINNMPPHPVSYDFQRDREAHRLVFSLRTWHVSDTETDLGAEMIPGAPAAHRCLG